MIEILKYIFSELHIFVGVIVLLSFIASITKGIILIENNYYNGRANDK